MDNRVTAFKSKNAKVYACGEKGLWETIKEQGKAIIERLKEPVELKDLDGKVLYVGKTWRGQGKDQAYQRVLEQAVKRGVALPRLDASNKKFIGLKIAGAKLQGASFEKAEIMAKPVCVTSVTAGYSQILFEDSIISNADLRDVNFKDVVLSKDTFVEGSNVAGANFEGDKSLRYTNGFTSLKGLDKAEGLSAETLKAWSKSQKTALNVANLKSNAR
ncbi:MAG: hypothetical protein AB7U85_08600 [Alphaproteobacteria bacterium]